MTAQTTVELTERVETSPPAQAGVQSVIARAHTAEEHAQLVEPLRQRVAKVEAHPLYDPEASMAVARANELLGIAEQTVTLAAELAQENHEEYEHAKEALAFAQQAMREITALARDPNRRQNTREIGQKLSTMTNTVISAANDVIEHEGGSASDSAKKIAYSAAAKEQSKKKQPAPTPTHNSRTCRSRSHHHRNGHDDDDDPRRPRITVSPRPLRVLPGGFAQISNTGLGSVIHGVDETAASAITANIVAMQGAASILSGKADAIDASGLTFGRGVRNVLRDDIGFNASLSQAVGHTATVASRTAGHVGNAMLHPATAIGAALSWLTSDAEGDLSAQLGQLLPAVNRTNWDRLMSTKGQCRRTFDTNGDGNIDMGELRDACRRAGLTDLQQAGGSLDMQDLIRVRQRLERTEGARIASPLGI